MPAPYRNSLILNRVTDASPSLRGLMCRYLWRHLEKQVKRLASDSAGAQHWGLKYLHMPLREPWEGFFSFCLLITLLLAPFK